MAFDLQYLITRTPIVDRNREIAFQRLSLEEPTHDILMPFMLRLANIESPQAVYFLPLPWVGDGVLLKKLAHHMVLVVDDPQAALAEQAREAGFRLATRQVNDMPMRADFMLAPYTANLSPTPDTIICDVETAEDEARAMATPAMYFSGHAFMSGTPPRAEKNIHPSHALILELMGAVQQEAEPRDIELLFKRDVTLAFKLLRYINSPWFGLASKVESVRHALSIIGYQQLLKWLALLAATAGQGASPALTHAAMVRARLMELIGTRHMEKRDADHLFLTGMLSLIDRIMGVPLEKILERANLPLSVSEALLGNEGKYRRFLALALACEGVPPDDEQHFSDIDVKAVNLAHLEAIEWATQISASNRS